MPFLKIIHLRSSLTNRSQAPAAAWAPVCAVSATAIVFSSCSTRFCTSSFAMLLITTPSSAAAGWAGCDPLPARDRSKRVVPSRVELAGRAVGAVRYRFRLLLLVRPRACDVDAPAPGLLVSDGAALWKTRWGIGNATARLGGGYPGSRLCHGRSPTSARPLFVLNVSS